MKKIFFILMMMVSAFAEAAITEEMPEVLYMVGNMNEWTTPIDGGTQYTLYDEDHDGYYTGEFDIPAQKDGLQFKIFIKKDDWNYMSFLSTNSDPIRLYNDETFNLSLTFEMTRNIVIDNWKGGKLKIEVFCCDSGSWEIILNGPDQPARPDWLKELYLVGEFNDWQLPTLDNLNGAYTIPLGINYYYAEKFEIPQDQASFYIVSLDPETGEATKWGHLAPFPPFKIYYNLDEDNPCMVRMTAFSQKKYDVVPFTIADFQGGEVQIVAFMTSGEEDSFQIFIYDYNAPWFDIPNPVYGIYDTGDGESDILSLPVDKEHGYFNYIWSRGSDIQMFFSSKESLQYDPSNCWGVTTDIDPNTGSGMYSLVKGGKPIRINFADTEYLKGVVLAEVDWKVGIVNITVTPDIVSTYPDDVYLSGSFNNWSYQPNDWVLKAVDNPDIEAGTGRDYKGVFEIKDNNSRFRFFVTKDGYRADLSPSYILNEDNISFASDPDAPIESVVDREAYGVWVLRDWTPGKLEINLHLRESGDYVIFRRLNDSAIHDIETDLSKPVYYNLQGIEVEEPTSGVYIKAQGSKREKVILK